MSKSVRESTKNEGETDTNKSESPAPGAINRQQNIRNLYQVHTLGLHPAFAYDRISAEVQSDGMSLEYQRAGAAKYAEEQGLSIVHRFAVVESASKEGRKTFNEMIDMSLKLGVRHLIFKNTDRMSRNYQDLVRIDRLIDEHDFKIHLYQTGMVIHRESSYNDRFLIGIQLAVAKHLSDKLRHDIREANSYKARKGTAPGHSPFGYFYDKREKMHRIDPAAAETVRFIFDEFDSGRYSLNELARLLNERGIKPPKSEKWRKGQIHKMVMSRFYHGEFVFRGETRQGSHEPYYEKERYEARLERLREKAPGRRRNRRYAFVGMLACSCGRVMTGDAKKNRYEYYKHVCPEAGRQIYMKEADILDSLNREVQRWRFSPAFAENLKELLRHTYEAMDQDRKSELGLVERKLAELEEKKKRLMDLYGEDRMDRELLLESVADLNARGRELDEKRRAFTMEHNELQLKVFRVVDELRDRPIEFLEADTENKAAILAEMAERVVFTGNRVRIAWKMPYSCLMRPAILRRRGMKKDGTKSSPLSTSMGQGRNEVNWKALEDVFLEFRLWMQAQ